MIYFGFDSSFIIQYLELQIDNVFMTCFVNFHFDKTIISLLRGEKSIREKQCEHNKITWNALVLFYFDPQTNKCGLEVHNRIKPLKA